MGGTWGAVRALVRVAGWLLAGRVRLVVLWLVVRLGRVRSSEAWLGLDRVRPVVQLGLWNGSGGRSSSGGGA